MKNIENVITSWREFLDYQGKTLKQGVQEMNETLGTNVLGSHCDEYAKGTRAIRDDILRYFCDEVFIFASIQMKLKGMELQNLLTFKQMTGIPKRKR